MWIYHLLVWWDLDTSIVPDVLGLRAFDSREPVAQVLPGYISNSVRVLVPDATATPMDFHDIILEDLSGTLDSRVRRIVPSDVTSLRRWWPSALFETMHRRQADMEYLRHACSVSCGGVLWSGALSGRGM